MWTTLQTAKVSDHEVTDLAASRALQEESSVRTTERMLWDSSVFSIAKEGFDNSLERKISQIRIWSNSKFVVVVTENSLLREYDNFETLSLTWDQTSESCIQSVCFLFLCKQKGLVLSKINYYYYYYSSFQWGISGLKNILAQHNYYYYYKC